MNLLTQLVAFSWALWSHAIDGFRIVWPHEAQARLDICQANECGHFAGDHCTACGCKCKGEWFNKLLWASESCPKGLWSAIEDHPSGMASPPSLAAVPSEEEGIVSVPVSTDGSG